AIIVPVKATNTPMHPGKVMPRQPPCGFFVNPTGEADGAAADGDETLAGAAPGDDGAPVAPGAAVLAPAAGAALAEPLVPEELPELEAGRLVAGAGREVV